MSEQQLKTYKQLKIELLSYMEGVSGKNRKIMDKLYLFLDYIEKLFFEKEINILEDRML